MEKYRSAGEQRVAAYGERAEEHFKLEPSPKLLRTLKNDAQFAVMRLISEPNYDEMTTPIPLENSYLIALQLKDFLGAELWVDDRAMPVGALLKDNVSFYDLRQHSRAYMKGSFDFVQFYVPQAIFDHLTDEIGLARLTELKVDLGRGAPDPIIANLSAALLPALRHPEETGTVYVDHIAFALAAHVAETYGGLRLEPASIRSGLSMRQEARAKELLRQCLEAEIRLPEIAGACGLPVGRFVRAFQQTTGMPPHRWLRAFRVERAKELLLGSDLALAQVAFACGFADQSHFSRVFVAWVGVPPGTWRRSRRA
jgi:AraC family transcriptional regulator